MRLAPLLLIGTPILCAGLGYGAGLLLKPAPPPPAQSATAAPAEQKLGTLAVRIYHMRTLATLTAEVTLEVAPDKAALYAAPEDAARLRQRCLALLLDAAETPGFRAAPVTADQIAALLQPVLSHDFPGILSVKIPAAGQIDSPRS